MFTRFAGALRPENERGILRLWQCANNNNNKKCGHQLRSIADYKSKSKTKEIREYDIPVPWGKIAVKEWGPKDGKPVVCIHGWLDNVNSYSPLIAELPSHFRYVSFDISGHGWSSHRPLGSFYGVGEYCSDIVRVVEHLKLEKFPIIGHSMGVRLCFLYNSMYPHKVTKLVALDEANPLQMSLEDQPVGIASIIQDSLELEQNRYEPRSFLRQEAIDLMTGAGLKQVTADALFERGFRPIGDGKRFVLNRDPRLRHLRSFSVLSGDILPYSFKSFNKHLLLFLASNSPYKITQDQNGTFRKAFAENCRSFKFVPVEGRHHAHIEHPDVIAHHIAEFFEHDTH